MIDRYLSPHTLTLAVGRGDGESYKLSESLKKVVKQYYGNVEIKLVTTGGTEENLEDLETKKADLATAQADIIAEKDIKSVRTVAALYRDYFQLIVNKRVFNITDADSPEQAFSKFIQKLNEPTSQLKVIEAPEQGGQRISFQDVAKHYGLEKNKNFIFQEIARNQDAKQESQKVKEDLKQGTISAIFRVRALGNRNIADFLLDNDIELLQIEQAEAMSNEHPTFQQNVEIPKGAYKGAHKEYRAIPKQNLKTIAVQRLLLAREDIPEQIVREITEVLNEHRKEIAQNLEDEVKPLTSSIGEPSIRDSAGISLHPGALNFYRRQEPPFIERYLSIIALVISIGSFAASIV